MVFVEGRAREGKCDCGEGNGEREREKFIDNQEGDRERAREIERDS